MSDVLVKPAFQSAVADSGDTTKLGPTAWNASRLFSGGVDGDIVASDAASATGASWLDPATLIAGLVPTTRTVNGHALSGDVIVTKGDVGLSSVEDTALSTWAGSANLTTFSPNVPLKDAANTFTGLQTFSGGVALTGVITTSVNGIGVTATDGLVLQNTTPATAGVPVQQGPDLRIRAHVWNTTTPADNTDDWFIRSVPTSGASPSSLLKIGNSKHGAATTFPLILNSIDHVLTLTGNVVSSGSVYVGASGGFFITGRAYITALAVSQFVLRDTNNVAGVGLDVGTDAILKVRTTGHGGDASLTALNLTASGRAYVGDGNVSLPAFTFISEPSLGFWRSGAGAVALNGALTTGSGISANATSYIGWANRAALGSANVASVNVVNSNASIGSQLNVGALPTIASGFGAGAAVTAGSTPLAGSVNTGAISASGVINFNGTAFPSAPFVVALNSTTGLAVKVVASATQLTLSPATGNFAASDVVVWHCISSK